MTRPRPHRWFAVVVGIALGCLSPRGVSQGTEEDLTPRIWEYLHETSDLAAHRQLAFLVDAKVTSADLERAVEQGPRLPMMAPGVYRDRPFRIPGTEVDTTYVLGIPESLNGPGPYPLWLAVHGTSGDGDQIFQPFWNELGPRGVIVVAPSEGRDIYYTGWGGRPRELALHMGLLDQLVRELPIDRSRIYVGGMSRGGHGSFELAMRYADRFAGAMPVSGGVFERDRPLIRNLHDVQLHMFVGEQDQKGLVEAGLEAARRLAEWGYPATAHFDPHQGHGLFLGQWRNIVPGLLEGRRSLAVRHLHFAVQNLNAPRHYWVRATALDPKAYAPGEAVPLSGLKNLSDEEARVGYLRYIEDRTPSIEAELKEDRLVLTTKWVKKFEVFLPRALVKGPVALEVVWNGRVIRRRWQPKEATCAQRLQWMRSVGGGDPAFDFYARLPVPD